MYEEKIEKVLQKHLPALADELSEIFSEMGKEAREGKCSAIVSSACFLICKLADGANETILGLINLIGNIGRAVLDDAERLYEKKGVDYIKNQIHQMLSIAFQQCLESVGFDWQKDLEEKIIQKLAEICDCPKHQEMRKQTKH